MSRIEWVLFGLDGTLVDHERAVANAFESLRSTAEVPRWMKDRQFAGLWRIAEEDLNWRFPVSELTRVECWRELVRSFDRSLSIARCDALYQRYFEAYLLNVSTFWDVPGALFQLNGLGNLGILARGHEQTEQRKLTRLGLTSIFSVVGISPIPWRSDAPQLIDLMSRVKGMPQKVVFVGANIERDLLPLSRLGIRTVWLNRTSSQASQTVPTIYSLDELPRYLAEVPGSTTGASM